MVHVAGVAGNSPIDSALKTVIREKASQVRLAIGLLPQIYFIVPYRRDGVLNDDDLVVPLNVGKLTSADVAGFLDSFVPAINQLELGRTGETRFEFEFKLREKWALFVTTISKQDESISIMARLSAVR